MDHQHTISQAFQEQYDSPPQLIIRAPGRVNIIGEHTDYNDGFVLPMAIERAVWLALRPRSDGRVILRSQQKDAPADFSLDNIQHTNGGWTEYVKGMAYMLAEAGYELSGLEGVLTSDIPVGAGLSSSAALEMGVACAFAAVSGFPFQGKKMALLGQKTENEWVGANTGIMDQVISANARAGHALLIDCRDLTIKEIPLPQGTAILVMDTMTRHDHTESGYNQRRADTEKAANYFGVSHLRDVTIKQLQTLSSGLDDQTIRRARHVLSENERVLQAVAAMEVSDAQSLGLLMSGSHASLRDDFQVTNDALNIMAGLAQEQIGCYGARMTGGGFGGCVVALVQDGKAGEIAAAVGREYEAQTGRRPDIFATGATAGTAVISQSS